MMNDYNNIQPGSYDDRVLGSLWGGAVGDAFGYAVEFKTLNSIRTQYGPNGITEPVLQDDKLLVSDDTQMTMFTLEGLLCSDLANNDDINEQIRLAYVDWLSTQTRLADEWEPTGMLCNDRSLWHSRAPGNTCVSALRYGGWGTVEKHINDSKGCGGVMRVAPLGFIYDWTHEQAFDVAANAAAITHGHPSGYWSAGALGAIINLLNDGIDLRPAVESTMGILVSKKKHEETSNAMQMALDVFDKSNRPHTENVALLGEGWVGEETLAIAIYAAMAGTSFPEVFSIASNHNGDSDSTASVAGQIYGAWKGLSDLPLSWVYSLDIYSAYKTIIDELINNNRP